MAIDIDVKDGIAEVVINNPPVNALGSEGWYEFADGIKVDATITASEPAFSPRRNRVPGS